MEKIAIIGKHRMMGNGLIPNKSVILMSPLDIILQGPRKLAERMLIKEFKH